MWGHFPGKGTLGLNSIDKQMRKYLKTQQETSNFVVTLTKKYPKNGIKVVPKWLQDNKVDVLEWLSQSPDLNPIVRVTQVHKRS